MPCCYNGRRCPKGFRRSRNSCCEAMCGGCGTCCTPRRRSRRNVCKVISSSKPSCSGNETIKQIGGKYYNWVGLISDRLKGTRGCTKAQRQQKFKQAGNDWRCATVVCSRTYCGAPCQNTC